MTSEMMRLNDSTDSTVKSYFIKQLIEHHVLKEGNFLLSSGQRSCYYYDFNQFNTGLALNNIGFAYYSAACQYFKSNQNKVGNKPFDVVYGCAYKGIMLATAISYYAWVHNQVIIPTTFNRKEIKDHGDLSMLVGNTDLKDKSILLVDDVVTTAEAIKKNLSIIKSYQPASVHILVGVNRTGERNLTIKDDKVTENIKYICTHEDVLEKLKTVE